MLALSALFMLGSQVRYIPMMRAKGIAVLEVKREAQAEFLAEMEHRSADPVWVNGGCRSYYQTPDGPNAPWPNWSFEFARRTRRFDLDAYEGAR